MSRRIVAALCLVLSPACRHGSEGNESEAKEAIATGFRYEQIAFSAQSSDGQPIAGVPLSYNLQAWQISVLDDSGFVPFPSLPHWKKSTVKAEVIGQTSAIGTFTTGKVRMTSLAAGGPDSLTFFSNPVTLANCPSGNQAFADLGELKAISKTPSDGSDDCGWNLQHATDQNKTLALTCRSSLDAVTIAQRVQAALATCQ